MSYRLLTHKNLAALAAVAIVAGGAFGLTGSSAFADDSPPPDKKTHITEVPEESPSARSAAPAWDGQTPVQPEFVDGQAQPVYKGHPLVKDEVFIPVPGVDTDRDGKDDQIRATVYRTKDTDLGDQGIKVPTVVRMSPYNGGFAEQYFLHDMKQAGWDPSQPIPEGKIGTIPDVGGASNNRPNSSFYTDRGFAFMIVDALGTNESTGCPTMLDGNEAQSTKAVVDWLAGRVVGKTPAGAEISSTSWSNGKVAMTGVSYDGTLPILASTTGVAGLETVIPISALTNFYDYYRVGGAVVEPAGYPGEDLDNYVSALLSTKTLQANCQYLAEDFAKKQDRATGQYSPFWDERNFLNNVGKVKTPTLIAAGLSDWNVRLDQTTKWYEALKKQGTPVKLVLHQGGHQTPPSSGDFNWSVLLNKWLSHYLFRQDNGVEKTPELSMQNADPGKPANQRSWQYQPSWPLPGSGVSTFNFRGTGAGSTSGSSSTTTASPTPSPAAAPAAAGSSDGAAAAAEKSGLVAYDPAPEPGAIVSGPDTIQTLADDAKTSHQDLATKVQQGRLIFSTNPAAQDIRLSGWATAKLNLSFSNLAPNLSLQLLDRSPDGSAKVVTRAWRDPQNRESLTSSLAVAPGTFYDMNIPFISTEYLLAANHRLEMMLYSTDIDGKNCTTLCLTTGTKISIDTSKSTLSVPFVGAAPQAFTVFGSEAPPAPPVTPTPTPSVSPSVAPTSIGVGDPTTSASVLPEPAAQGEDSLANRDTLANTGVDDPARPLLMGALALVLGVALTVAVRQRRKRQH